MPAALRLDEQHNHERSAGADLYQFVDILAMNLHRRRITGGSPMELRGRYKYAIETAKSFGMDGSADERDGKLYFKGTVQTQEQANKIWDAIKTIPTWQQDVVAN